MDKKQQIIRELNLVFQRKKDLFSLSSRIYPELFVNLKDFLYAGKFFRGSLVLAGHRLAQGKDDTVSLCTQMAVGIELYHTGILIHDDIIDEDGVRRGMSTIHKRVQQHLPHISAHDAMSTAMCIGDLCFFLASECLMDRRLPAKSSFTIRKEIDEVFQVLALGEMNDIWYGHVNHDRTKEELYQHYEQKTGLYTLYLPLFIGYMVVKQDMSEEIRSWLRLFCKHVGIAYQLVDDYIGFFGDPIQTGKSNTTDIIKKKKTLLRILLLTHVDSKLSSFAQTLFSSVSVPDEKDIKHLKALARESTIREEYQKEVDIHKEAAYGLISSQPFGAEAFPLLQSICTFAFDRGA